MLLPKILSGPILRKVDINQIHLWIATSDPYEIEVKLYRVEPNHDLLSTRGKSQTIQFGKQLFIHLLTVVPKHNTFPVDEFIGYNLFFSNGDYQFDLHKLGLLDQNNPSRIIYESFIYPTLFIPGTDSTSFLYGSCRKIHGKGIDSLSSGDRMLEMNAVHISKRPSALFLIGDQIYADDVSEVIFPFIRELSHTLIGGEEDWHSIDKRIVEYKNRKQICKSLCHFTSRKCDNHLFSFGEYAAMYLLSFSPFLWKEILPSISNNQETVDEIHFAQSTYLTQRLLANIPTYMMFDDHDVTDDWNITKKWKENVESSPLGRHVIANALTAYFAFQGWGNDPSRFSNDFLLPIINYVQTYETNTHIHTKWIESILQFSPWTYVAPTKPKVLCLDTRTSREWSFCKRKIGKWTVSSTSGPELINEQGWRFAVRTLYESSWKKNEALVLVSPAPLYGIEIIESFLQKYISPLRTKGVPVTTTFDLEAWRMNGSAVFHFYEVLKELDPSVVTILSGDAHLASAVDVSTKVDDDIIVNVLQLTSSPLKNESFRGLKGLALKTAIVLYNIFQIHSKMVRICDNHKNLHYDSLPEKHKVKLVEEIHYLPVNQKSILEVSNNLGLVSFSSGTTYHQLLKHSRKKNR